MDKSKRLAVFLSAIILSSLIGLAIATQQVAYTCEYDSALREGISITDNFILYKQCMFIFWYIKLQSVIPTILSDAENSIYICMLIGITTAFFIIRRKNINTTHGSASWGDKKDIKKAHLRAKEGVILGINPFTYTKNLIFKQTYLLQYDINEKSHILLVAPTRSGKGVSTIVPTLLTWRESVFVLDIKGGENWHLTAAYRKKGLKQKVLKFDPLSTDGTTARWNPLAEIRYRTDREYTDVMTIANMIADPTGKMSSDPKSKHWVVTSSALIEAVIVHLLYMHDREHRPVPNMGDVARFIASPSRSFDEAINEMMYYPHITPDEAFSDDNILEKIYGDYVEINDFNVAFTETEQTDTLKLRKIRSEILSIPEKDLDNNPYYSDYSKFLSLSEIKEYFKNNYKDLDFTVKPYCYLLTHPRVASGAYTMSSRPSEEQGSVLSTAQTGFQLYQDPVVSKNTAVSDFKLEDIMDYEKPVSLYLVAAPSNRNTLQPMFRLMLDFILRRNMETSASKSKHKCLLLLDEFPQIGKIDQFEMAIATMAGYQLRSLIIVQALNQLYDIYGKNTSIIDNCAVRVFHTPNNLETQKAVSSMLGSETITVTSKSETGNLFKKNTSWQSTARELLKPDEVGKMPKDKEIVFVSGQKPILAKKLFYYMVPFFQQRVSETQVTQGGKTRYVPNKKYPSADEYSMKSDSCTVVDSYVNLLPKETKGLKDLVGAAKINKAVKKPKPSIVKDKIQQLLNSIFTLIGKKIKTVMPTKKVLTKEEIKQRIKPEDNLPQEPSVADFDIAEVQKGNNEIMDKESKTAEDKDIMDMLKGHNTTIDTGFDDLVVAAPNPANELKSEIEKTDIIDENEPGKFDKTFDDDEKPTLTTHDEQKTEEKFSEGFDEEISSGETSVPEKDEKTSEMNITDIGPKEVINCKSEDDIKQAETVTEAVAVIKNEAIQEIDKSKKIELEKEINTVLKDNTIKPSDTEHVETIPADNNEIAEKTIPVEISETVEMVKNDVVQKTEPIKETAPKKVIRHKFIRRKQTPSVSENEKQMLEILASVGITSPTELKLYLTLLAMNEEDIKRKIADYIKELEDLYELYRELEAA